MEIVAKIIDILIEVLTDAMDGTIDGPGKKKLNKRLKKLFLRARKEFWKVVNALLRGRLSQRSATLLILALSTAKTILLAVHLPKTEVVKVGDGWEADDQEELDNLLEFPAAPDDEADPVDVVAAAE